MERQRIILQRHGQKIASAMFISLLLTAFFFMGSTGSNDDDTRTTLIILGALSFVVFLGTFAFFASMRIQNWFYTRKRLGFGRRRRRRRCKRRY